MKVETDEFNDLMGILFGSALESGLKEISWQDAPRLMARLERAGFVVRGEMLDRGDFGRKVPVISVELKINIKEFPNRA